MNTIVEGLHHVTALSSDAQKTIDFYSGLLGLRLVKKTINFDAPDVYHLYFGNEKGDPGTILTFFPYPGIPRGRKGKGQLTVTSFSIPLEAIDYWIKRLEHFNIKYQSPHIRFKDEVVLYFEDFDGLGLELVGNDKDNRVPFSYGIIPIEHSIKGFYGITLSEECYEKSAGLLVGQMDHQLIDETGNRFRFSTDGKPGNFVDIVCTPDILQGLPGCGTVHHVAFATKNEQTQKIAQQKLIRFGLNVTPILDREYFHSIYFREPGGVLFEIATLPPGFAIDEPLEELGMSLKLPSWEEKNRMAIESALPIINLNLENYKDHGHTNL
ncbi:Putative ring-cleaving dioxygenase MhqO [Candidatus Rubidus massiliensis]|nr:Putative ring-cleaving dioxygenase MhqO [Candidatus Rubidus massiliensis]